MGSSHESGHGSSVDSLGIKVKNLLQFEHPTAQPTPWVGEQEPCGSGQKPGSSGASSAFSRGEVGVPQSENSSSLDSLAVRVRTLLEDERPVTHGTQMLQRAEGEEEKAHAWVKLKLATHPPCPVPDLNEEDRQMIEDIKRQQRLSARKPDVLKNQLWDNGTQRISSHSLIPQLNTERSNVPGQSDLRKAIYSQHSQVSGFPAVNQVEVGPGHEADSTFPTDTEMTSLTSGQSHANKQLQTPSDNVLYSRPNFHTPVCNMTGVHLMGQANASREIIGEERSVLAQAKWTISSSSTEPTKQITSITFASRKRSHSPFASCAPCPSLPGATPCNLRTFKAQSVSSDQLNSSRQQPKTFKSHPSDSPTANHKPDMKVGFSSGKHFHQKDKKGELFPEDVTASQETFQDSCVDQKVHFIMETHEEVQASSQELPDLRRHNQALDDQLNGEGAMTDPLFSLKPCLQKTGQACTQGRAVKGPGSHDCEPFFLKGKETATTETKLTFDAHPCSAGETGMGSISPVPPAFPDCFSAVVPANPSSPTKKALSGVHITLSPKRIDLDRPSPLDAGPGVKQASGFKMTSEPATSSSPPSEATSRLKPPKTQESSHFPRPLSSPESHLRHSPVLGTAKLGSHGSEEGRQHFPVAKEGNARAEHSGDVEGIAKATVASQTQRMSSDAVTQITTESPERTTYSAEIFVSTSSNEVDSPSPLLPKRDRLPSTAAPAVKQTSILEREAGMPVLLPYRPPGSSEMYYVPCPKEALRLFRVRSETTVESSHSGLNDAVPPEFPPQMLGSWDENTPSAVAIRHREGIYSKRTAPRNAWGEGKVSAQNGVEVLTNRLSISEKQTLEKEETE
ncbi:hypothetical protein JRQ81_017034 [Phrynocephalus forsythii]|uniref:Uncharacterized protein n=1 Tax=Phrynocephalus forsythii TaxID=171643 RepID=A0A9Q1B214_9SAUR|nr:hypothetical protein JRQ81_017034 [Phrynocephalus forsythii]